MSTELSSLRNFVSAKIHSEPQEPSDLLEDGSNGYCAPTQKVNGPMPVRTLTAEAEFYGGYTWCLNAFPTIREVVSHLTNELQRFRQVRAGWQKSEATTNIFLLSCSITDTADDYLAGPQYDFSKASRAV